ncbi:MAG: hypothetical protein LBT05_16860 [Planctomycetaceae bacterium]|nr:hypothetical protein [Planctomycetaceae bacterium]
MRLLQTTTRKRLICQLLLAALLPVLVAPQLSLCFCSDGYGVCIDCRDFAKYLNRFATQKEYSVSAKNACGDCDKNTEIENVSISTLPNIEKNCGTEFTCVKIDVSFASVNYVLNEKEQSQTNDWLFAQVLSFVVLPFQTINMPDFTAFSRNESTCRLSVRLHLLQSVFLI